MLNIILEVCAGMVLFLYAISSLSKTLIHAIGDKALVVIPSSQPLEEAEQPLKLVCFM